jgi:hypothetical protein
LFSADLLREKSSADLFREKYYWLVAYKPDEQTGI